MLIDSHRITAQDRKHWGAISVMDKVRPVEMIAAAARKSITEFAHRKCCCTVSWGKDSIVIAHLVATSGVSVPLYFVRTHRVNPDCDAVRDAFLAEHKIEYHEIVEPVESWPHWGFGLKLIPFDRSIHGVRAAESSERKLSACVHGVATENKCRPILRWKTEDVFAYIEQRGLPLHPAYACTGGGRWDRNRIRVGTLGGERGNGIGREQFEREYYGDVLSRLAAVRLA